VLQKTSDDKTEDGLDANNAPNNAGNAFGDRIGMTAWIIG
jgi:hypothetical protein